MADRKLGLSINLSIANKQALLELLKQIEQLKAIKIEPIALRGLDTVADDFDEVGKSAEKIGENLKPATEALELLVKQLDQIKVKVEKLPKIDTGLGEQTQADTPVDSEELATLVEQLASIRVQIESLPKVDISASAEDLNELVDKLASIKVVAETIPPIALSADDGNLEELTTGIAEVKQQIESVPAIALTTEVDGVSSLSNQIDDIRSEIESLPAVTIAAQGDDLAGINSQLENLKTEIESVPPVSLSGDGSELAALTDGIESVKAQVESIPPIALTTEVDGVSQLIAQVESVKAEIEGLPAIAVEANADELAAITASLDGLKAEIESIPGVDLVAKSEDLSSIISQLENLKAEIESVPAIAITADGTDAIDGLPETIAEANAGLDDLADKINNLPELPSLGGDQDSGRLQQDTIALAQALRTSYEEASRLKAELNLPVDGIAAAINQIRQFESVNISIDDQFAELSSTLGINIQQFQQLRQVAGFSIPAPPVDDYARSREEIVKLAQALRTSFGDAEKLKQSLDLPTDTIVRAVNEIRKFESVKFPIDDQFDALSDSLGVTIQQFQQLRQVAGFDLPTPDVDAFAQARQEAIALSQALRISYEEAQTLQQQLSGISVEGIAAAIGQIRQFEAIDLPLTDQFDELSAKLGVTQQQFEALRQAAGFDLPAPPVDDYAAAQRQIIALAQALGLSAKEADKLQKELDLPSDTIVRAVARLRELQAIDLDIDDQIQVLNRELGISADKFKVLSQTAKGVKLDDIGGGGGFANALKGVGLLSFGFNQVTQAVGQLRAAAMPAYEALIGANERLNQQILQVASSLSATSNVTVGGRSLETLEAIRALQPKIKGALEDVSTATLDLVGVTDQTTNQAFVALTKQAGQLNSQLQSLDGSGAGFKDSIEAASKLAPGLIAALGTYNLGADQIQDEINNLVRGEIDRTAQLANSIGIKRSEIELWREQGTIVANLQKKFEPYLVANKEAAKSVGGITSNFQQLFETITRKAGEPLLAPFVDALQKVYDGVKDSQNLFVDLGQGIADAILPPLKAIGDVISPIFAGIFDAFKASAPGAVSVLENFGTIAAGAISQLKPLGELLGNAFRVIGEIVAANQPLIDELWKSIQDAGAAIAKAFEPSAPELQKLGDAIGELLKALAPLLNEAVLRPIIAGFTVLGQIAPPAIKIVSATLKPLVDAITETAKAAGFLINTFGKPFGFNFEDKKAQADAAAIGKIASEADKTRVALAALNDERSKGGKGAKFDNDKAQEQSKLAEKAKQQLQQIDGQIKAQEALKAAAAKGGQTDTSGFDRQIDALKNTKTQLEATTKAYAEFADQVQVSSRKAANIGSSAEQAARELKAAERALDNAQDNEEAGVAAKRIQAALQTSQRLGQINAEQAAFRLDQLRKDGRLEVDAQLKAADDLKRIQEDATKAEVDTIKTSIAEAEAARAEGRVSEEQSIQEITALKVQEVEKQIELNRRLQQSATGPDKERLLNEERRLNADLGKVRLDGIKQAAEARKQQQQLEIDKIKTSQAQLQAAIADGTRGEADAQKELTQLTINESQARIRQLEIEQAAERNPTKRKQIAEQIKQQQTEISKARTEARKREEQERLKDFDEQKKLLESEFQQGTVGRKEYSDRLLQISQGQLNEEEKQVRSALERIKATDKEGREALNVKLAEINAKRVAAVKESYERELAIINDAYEKGSDAIRDAVAARELAIAQAEANGASSGEIDRKKIALTKDRIQQELRLEQDKLRQLQALPQLTNPQDRARQENEIRDQAAKTVQLQKQLVEQRVAAEKAAVDEILKANEKANRELELAAVKRSEAIKRAELEALQTQGADVEAIGRLTAAKELASRREQLDEQVRLKQEQLDKLAGLENQNNSEVKAQKEALEGELARLAIDRIEVEKQALEELRQERLRQIEIERQDANAPLERRLELLRQAKDLLAQQNSLLDAQAGLASAISGLEQQRLGFAAEDARERGDSVAASQIERQIAVEQLNSVIRENEVRVKKFELSQAQREQEQQSLLLQAQIAEIEARAALAKAEASGASAREIEALKEVLALRKEQIGLTKQSSEDSKKVSELERQTLQVTNQTALERAQRGVEKADRNISKAQQEKQQQQQQQQQSQQQQQQQKQPETQGAQQSIDAFGQAAQTTSVTLGQAAQSADKTTQALTRTTSSVSTFGAAAQGQSAAFGVATQSVSKTTQALSSATSSVIAFGDALGQVLTNQVRTGVPARAEGGKIPAGLKFLGAERGREVAIGDDGVLRLLNQPGLYQLSQPSLILNNATTENILKSGAARVSELLQPVEQTADQAAKPVQDNSKPAAIEPTYDKSGTFFLEDSSKSFVVKEAPQVMAANDGSFLIANQAGTYQDGRIVTIYSPQTTKDLRLDFAVEPTPISPKSPVPTEAPKVQPSPAPASQQPKAVLEKQQEYAIGERPGDVIDLGNLEFRKPKQVRNRRDGGSVGAGERFVGTEVGPELLAYNDGSFALLDSDRPTLYKSDKPGTVIPANETQEITNRIQEYRPGKSRSGVFDLTTLSQRIAPDRPTLDGQQVIVRLDDGAIVDLLGRMENHLGQIYRQTKVRPSVPVIAQFSSPASQGWDEALARVTRSVQRL